MFPKWICEIRSLCLIYYWNLEISPSYIPCKLEII